MKITRRNFVQSLGTAAAIAVSGASLKSAFAVTNAPNLASPIPSATGLLAMSEAEVRRLVGAVFIATSNEGRSFELKLAEVTQVGRRANAKRGYAGECFSAIFKTRGSLASGQGIYEIKGAGTDKFSALLVPTGRRQTEFEMIVNRLSR